MSSIGVFTVDAALVVRTWDQGIAAMTGIRGESAVGRALTDLVPDLASRGFTQPFARVLSEGVVEVLAPAFHAYLIPCAPGAPSDHFDQMQQHVTIGPLREHDRIVGAMVTIEDVTARLDRQRDLAKQLRDADPDGRIRAARELERDASVDPQAAPLDAALRDDDWRVRRSAVRTVSRRSDPALVESLIKALRQDHQEFSVVSSALQILTTIDVDVVSPLIELMEDAEADVRIQAALALGEQRDRRATPALLSALSDPDANVRFHAIEALGKIGDPAALESLAAAAESGDFFLAFAALDALVHLGDPAVASRLAPLLADQSLRPAVADALGELGDEAAVEPLARVLNERGAPVGSIVHSLARLHARLDGRYGQGPHIAAIVARSITPEGSQQLLDALASARGNEVRPFAVVLGWIRTPAVHRALTRLLGEPSARDEVLEALVRSGADVVDLLVEQLNGLDDEVRHAAVTALGRVGDSRATPALVQLLDGHPSLVVTVAVALAKVGDARAFEPLFSKLGHPDPAVRQAVIGALNSIGHPEMPARIVGLLDAEDPRTRESAARIAGYFGYVECADRLLAHLDDPDEAVRRAVVEHLPFLDDSRVAGYLSRAIASETPRVRAAAALALSRVEDPTTVPPLVAALGDDDGWVRYYAVRAVAQRQLGSAVARVSELAEHDSAMHVRLAAIETLGAIGGSSPVPVLATLVASTVPEIAAAAQRALAGIDDPAAWPPLHRALRDEDPIRRRATVEALTTAVREEIVETLQWIAAGDGDAPTSLASLGTLGRIAAGSSPIADAAVSALVALLAEPARRADCTALLATLPARHVDRIAVALSHPRPDVRTAAVDVLGRMKHPAASAWLRRALADQAASVREAAIVAFRHLGSRGLEQPLAVLARQDPDPGVRRAAAALVGSAASPRD
jgi:HEAT repeat protein